ncbi:MAG: DUF922 domain-containing protein [Bacteroidota bacterium]
MKSIYFVLIVAFICCVSGSLHAQTIKWDTNTPLTWTDFSGTIDKNNPYYAHTQARINYNYKWRKSDYLFTYEFKIDAGFEKNASWVRPGKESPELLQHEQLHFDISELFARKLSVAFNTKKYTANYEQEIKDIFAQIMKEVGAMQEKYDAETNHSANKDKQQEWETYVKEQLKQTPSY